MFSGSSLPDWVLEATNGQLFQIGLEKKQTIIKRAIFAINNNTQDQEVLVTEISDGRYYLPALIDPDDVRPILGLDKNATLNCQELTNKVLEVKAYMIAAYRFKKVLYPYIIILELELKEKGPIQSIDSTVEDVSQHTKVKEWIRLLTSTLPDSKETVSSLFNPEEIAQNCLDIQVYEPIVEMILSTLYKNRTLPANHRSHPTNKSNNQQLGELSNSTRAKESTESRKRMASETNSQATPKRVKTDESSASNPTDIPIDFDEQCQKSIQAEFDAMTFIPDEHVLPYTAQSLSIAPSITSSPTPSPNMDLDVLPMQNAKLPSPPPPPSHSAPSTIEASPIKTNQLPAQPALLANSLKAPSKCLSARQRRLAFEKIRRESLLEFLHF